MTEHELIAYLYKSRSCIINGQSVVGPFFTVTDTRFDFQLTNIPGTQMFKVGSCTCIFTLNDLKHNMRGSKLHQVYLPNNHPDFTIHIKKGYKKDKYCSSMYDYSVYDVNLVIIEKTYDLYEISTWDLFKFDFDESYPMGLFRHNENQSIEFLEKYISGYFEGHSWGDVLEGTVTAKIENLCSQALQTNEFDTLLNFECNVYEKREEKFKSIYKRMINQFFKTHGYYEHVSFETLLHIIHMNFPLSYQFYTMIWKNVIMCDAVQLISIVEEKLEQKNEFDYEYRLWSGIVSIIRSCSTKDQLLHPLINVSQAKFILKYLQKENYFVARDWNSIHMVYNFKKLVSKHSIFDKNMSVDDYYFFESLFEYTGKETTELATLYLRRLFKIFFEATNPEVKSVCENKLNRIKVFEQIAMNMYYNKWLLYKGITVPDSLFTSLYFNSIRDNEVGSFNKDDHAKLFDLIAPNFQEDYGLCWYSDEISFWFKNIDQCSSAIQKLLLDNWYFGLFFTRKTKDEQDAILEYFKDDLEFNSNFQKKHYSPKNIKQDQKDQEDQYYEHEENQKDKEDDIDWSKYSADELTVYYNIFKNNMPQTYAEMKQFLEFEQNTEQNTE